MSGAALLVFARAPVPGQVKTRLGPALGPEDAARLYLAFLADVLRAGIEAGYARRRLYVSGDAGALRELARQHGYELRAQAAGDLGTRMDAALQAELAAGAAVLIGSDAPTLPAALLGEASARLRDGADLVLGPACDGGYWLVGARRPCPDLFSPGIAWGGADVLGDTLERLAALRAAGWAVALLPFWYDVDTPADLRLLRAHLAVIGEAAAPETSRALAAMSDKMRP